MTPFLDTYISYQIDIRISAIKGDEINTTEHVFVGVNESRCIEIVRNEVKRKGFKIDSLSITRNDNIIVQIPTSLELVDTSQLKSMVESLKILQDKAGNDER